MARIGREIMMGRKAPTPPPYKPGDKVKRPAPPPVPPQPYAMNKFGRNPPPPDGMVKPPPAPKLVYVYPPAVYTQVCEKTPFTGTTFGDAVLALQVALNELDVCGSRVDGLIKWQRDNAAK